MVTERHKKNTFECPRSCNLACHVHYLFRYNAITNSFKRLTIFASNPNMFALNTLLKLASFLVVCLF